MSVLLLYYHNDSLMFLHDETKPSHKSPYLHETRAGLEFGSGLGQWEDDFDGKDCIEELAVGGAKSYSYQTAYGCTKKGKVMVKETNITLDRANTKVVSLRLRKAWC